MVGNGSACVVGGTRLRDQEGTSGFITKLPPSPPWDMTCRRPSAPAWRRDREELIMVSGDGSMQMKPAGAAGPSSITAWPIKTVLSSTTAATTPSARRRRISSASPWWAWVWDSHDLSFPSMEKLAWAYGYPYTAHPQQCGDGDRCWMRTLAMDGPVICEIFCDRGSAL